MYEDITFEVIMDRMLDRVPDHFDKREGSIIYDALAPAAIEILQMYFEMDNLLKMTYADTAIGEFLNKRCAERGIYREPATKAVLEAVFTPSTLEIEIGARFSCETLNYTIIKKVKDGDYLLECETEGNIGNSTFGQLIPIDYIDGLETATITRLSIPGEDEESDDSLRERYLRSFDIKAYGGNVEDYIRKTNAIVGVGSTKVTPVWNGGGTVKLTILNSEFSKASDTLIQSVQDIIDPTGDATGVGIAPIGHIVTVDTVSERTINISATMLFEEGFTFDSLKTTIENVIKDYLFELRRMWADGEFITVRISQLESRIMGVDGVIDVINTKINQSAENRILGKYEIPIFGGVINA